LLPIGLLMQEHRVIEKIVPKLEEERRKITDLKQIDPIFIDTAVDFFRTYADRTHHGKEEDILFKELEKKQLTKKNYRVMNELVEEHRYARRTVQSLLKAKEKYIEGDEDAAAQILENLGKLIELYPLHIEKEDKYFFYDAMDYFTEEEQSQMLERFYEFDRNMIHEKYRAIVGLAEPEKGHILWKCTVCGYLYDPVHGDSSYDLRPGVSFEDLDDEWVCPVCYAPKSKFIKVE
jgi:hemerythrin-like domain-containing protein/rubredoxin